LSGKVFFDDPWIARLVAPNVPKAIRGYSDPELAGCFVMACARTDRAWR
jgi:hypothetical protein